MTAVRAVSHGGGHQSTALLVLAAQGKVDFPLFVFANVGDRAENPETLWYLADVAMPFAEAHGIELVERRWVTRKGQVRDLYDDVMSSERTIDIPVRLASGAFGNRKCTERYKIDVVAREMKARGATADQPATVAIGISTDEYQRAKVGIDPAHPWVDRVNPLLDLGLSRADCDRIVKDAGLPLPPKSSCYFCPFQGREQWRRRKRHQPELFEQAVQMETRINEHREGLGLDRVGLASAAVPLDQAIDDQLSFSGMDDETCDTGSCFT
jgi:3'-phosphoadenosine 5'-phosphosulfate sulfotransferase (PAPS reductase)/FAD synthetase